MSFDVHNPWEAHAYFALGFWCADCDLSLEIDFQDECSDEWCIQLARIAFETGWFIPLPDPDGAMDLFTAHCPECGQKHGLTRPAYERFVVHAA